jgi:site-specific DNA-methyltransferase (adenine-specific)
MLNAFHNPDVLTCLANLSSDEVFTPPDIANEMLDNLPVEIWSDETATFLDPASKSGVFLREITKRLINGLEKKIPDIEERLDHILKRQVFGIGTTKLTSEISRRTLYCSKQANGKFSIVKFVDEEGNLKFFESQHF